MNARDEADMVDFIFLTERLGAAISNLSYRFSGLTGNKLKGGEFVAMASRRDRGNGGAVSTGAGLNQKPSVYLLAVRLGIFHPGRMK
jgi:hypothetical protein